MTDFINLISVKQTDLEICLQNNVEFTDLKIKNCKCLCVDQIQLNAAFVELISSLSSNAVKLEFKAIVGNYEIEEHSYQDFIKNSTNP